MKIIVTGANGFIGSSLIKKLLVEKFEIFAIDISFANDHLGDNKLVHKIEAPLDRIAEYKSQLPVSAVAFYHLAWQGVNGPDKTDPIVQIHNIEMALSCAKIAKELGCKKFLCAGTIAERAVESLPILSTVSGGMMYCSAKYCTHIMIETFCKNIGLNFVWMQFSNIYGPNNKTGNLVSYTLGELLNKREASFGPALQPYDFVYVDDLIEAILRLGVKDTNKNFYYIGSGTPRILKDYLFEIGKCCGREELIKIGTRPDDGIEYTFEMFDVSDLINDIGNYISDSFENHIAYTIKNY